MNMTAKKAGFGRLAGCVASGVLAVGMLVEAGVGKTGDALVVESAGLNGLFIDEKDAGLKRALGLLDERISELPKEFGDEKVPAGVIDLVMDVMMSPMTLQAGWIEGADPRQGPPFWAQLTVNGGNEQQTNELAGRFAALVAQMGGPVGAVDATTGLGKIALDKRSHVYHGVRGKGQDSRFTLALMGLSSEAKPTWTGPALPNGVKPAMWMRLDFAQLQGLIGQLEKEGGREMQDLMPWLAAMGLAGEDAGALHAAAGYGVDRMHSALVFTGARSRLEKMGAMPASMIREQDLRLIPADATYASVSKFNPKSVGQQLQEMAAMMQRMERQRYGAMGEDGAAEGQEEAPDVMKMIEEQTGINPQRDVLDHLGETMGMYLSDTTGGGGWLSMVGFVEVKNEEGMRSFMAKLMGMVNGIGKQSARGYVRMSERKEGEQSMWVLEFPGLPVPMELSMAIGGGYMLAAATPTGLMAGMKQMKAGKEHLGSNANFVEMGGEKAVGAMQMTFMDTPRLVRQGYGVVSLWMSALSNAVKQPNGERGAGVIMPSYADLMKGAKAMLSVTVLEGGDLVMRGQSDRSAVVNGCGVMGAMGGLMGLYAAALGAGVMLPAIGQAQRSAHETAQGTQSMVQLRAWSQAATVYAVDHNDSVPTSAQELIDGGFITADLLRSPKGPALDGGADYWFRFDGTSMSKLKDPMRAILGYDRAMYMSGEKVAVVFFDGHGELVEAWELEGLTGEGDNAGVDFDIPGWE